MSRKNVDLNSVSVSVSVLALAITGLSTIFVLLRRNPVAIFNFGIELNSGLAAVVIVGGLLVLMPLVGRRFSIPERFGFLAFLAAMWSMVWLSVNHGGNHALEVIAIAVTATYATFLSFYLPSAGSVALLWGPALTAMIILLLVTLIAGPQTGGFFGLTGSIAFGQLMVVGFLLTYFFSERFFKHRHLIFAAGSVFIVGVMLSGSRGALVGLIVAVVLIVVGALVRTGRAAALREVKRFSLLSILTVVLSFLMVGIVLRSGSPPVILRKLAETFQLSEQVGSVQIPFYSSGRFQIWSSTLEQFETFVDVLVGKGQSTVQIGSLVFYPHNLFLELLLIGGLVTVVPFVLFLVFLFRKMFDPVYAGRFDFFVLAATTGVFSMFSGDLNYNIVFFFFLGLVYGQVLKHTGREILMRKSLPKEPL